jgi:hypothetical protein
MSTPASSPQIDKPKTLSESNHSPSKTRRQLAPIDQFPSHHIPNTLTIQLWRDYFFFESKDE